MPGFFYPSAELYTMQEVPKQDKKSDLAIVIARGGSIATWAKQNDVCRRTVFNWAKEPKVREEVEELRRHALDLALGRMNSQSAKAVDGICRLAEGAQSESVQFRALRTILADQMNIARFSTLDQRMVELEQFVKAQQKGACGPGYNSPPGQYSTAPPG
jgi:hypothetical protein